MNLYHFTIVVRDANADLVDLEDQFFEAGCEDALLCQYNGIVYLEFGREAKNAAQAITSALDSIRTLGFKDLIVEKQGFSTLAEINRFAVKSKN